MKEGLGNSPTFFEMRFVLNEKRYSYSFSYTRDKILTEFLYRKGEGREVMLFGRQDDTIEVSSGFQGSNTLMDAAIEATRDNALFLSTCDMLNVKGAKELFEWFNQFRSIDGIDTESEEVKTVNIWENEPTYRQKIKDYLKLLSLDFIDLDVSIKDFSIEDLPTELDEDAKKQLAKRLEGKRGFKTTTAHYFYDQDGKKTDKKIFWKLDEHESQGTQKAFHLSGPILKTLLDGGVLIIDEIEAKMHPIMTLNTIKLFLNPETNPNKAQILFATHDTNLLTYTNLRRDQINFVEKNKWEASEIYALSDVKHMNEQAERMDTDKEKRYFEGRYGAIPALGSFTQQIAEMYGKKG
ncbi:MAG: ATP-binding protein [Bacteroidetes bacterium]|nr:MAG: ATP-binding protein [Bacteroidota bacterium]